MKHPVLYRQSKPTFTYQPKGNELVEYFRKEPFALRVAHAASKESLDYSQPSQDALKVVANDRSISLALCDGVSASFYGNLAANLLADELSDFLMGFSGTGDQFKDSTLELLAQLQGEGSKIVAQYRIPQRLDRVVVETLEEKRKKGSESMFVLCRVDLPSLNLPRGAVHLVWMGDSRIRLWGKGTEKTKHLKHPKDTDERWSTQKGTGKMPPHFFSSELLGADQSWKIDHLLFYSDGFEYLDQFEETGTNKWLEDLMDFLQELPENDDISLIELWLDREPKGITTPPRLETEDLRIEFYKNRPFVRWKKIKNVRRYEVALLSVESQRIWVSRPNLPLEPWLGQVHGIKVRAFPSPLNPGAWTETLTLPNSIEALNAKSSKGASRADPRNASGQESSGVFKSMVDLATIIALLALIGFLLLVSGILMQDLGLI